MPSKKSFLKGLFQRISPKKLIIAAIISIVILFPTIFATVFVIRSNKLNQTSFNDSLTVSLYDSTDTELFRETGTVSTYGDDSLVAIFNTIRKNLSQVSEIPQTADQSNPITVHMTDSSKTDVLLLYFTFGDTDSYCLWNNEAYKISEDNVETFLTSPYSEPLYSHSNPPALLTADSENILPTSTEWYYKNLTGRFEEASAVKLTDPSTVYHITGEFALSFATVPDTCSVEIFDGKQKIYSGTLAEARSITVDSNKPLNVKITAQWKYSDRSFHGYAEYDVSVIIHNRAEFSVISDTVSNLGFTILKGINIADISKLSFSSPHISPPRFSLFGETAYAVILCPADFNGNNIEFTVSYGASMSAFNLSVNRDNGLDGNKINNSMEKLGVNFFGIASEFDSPPYLFGKIVLPSSDIFANTLKVGDKDGEYYSYRRVYSCSDGAGIDVHALSGGTVSYVGKNEELGRYAVVDIGLGLSVIYSNLSSAEVFVDDIIAAGDVIGKTGNIPRGEEGFSLALWYNGHLLDSDILFVNT